MDEILSIDSSADDILRHPHLQEIWTPFYNLKPAGLPPDMPQDEIVKSAIRTFFNLDASGLVDGLNAIILNKLNGISTHFALYDAEECRREPALTGVTLDYFPAGPGAPFALICPGGGYMVVVSFWEGFPVAAALNRMGYSAFVLTYRTGANARYPAPMDDLARAVAFIHKNAKQFDVSVDNYAVFGFSAGGHLAGSFGTSNMGYASYGLPAPAAIALSYPVVSMGELAHAGSRETLLGKDYTPTQAEQTSIEQHVDHSYPATFLWHCRDDQEVPYGNSAVLSASLKAAGVAHILKSVDAPGHGLGLGKGTPADGWLADAVDFWRSNQKT